MARFRTVGVDIGGTFIKIASLWSDGTLIHTESIPTQPEDGPEAACQRILEVVRRLLASEGIATTEMRALGVDSAGIIDTATQVVVDSPNLRAFEGYPMARTLAEALGVPVYLENDVNAMAYAEWRCGAGRGAQHLVCLTLGTGVGGGLILDGRLYRGAGGAAGEVGHVTLDHHGPPCTCPNLGCLERHVGAAYIVERALRHLAEDARPSSLRRRLADGLSPELLFEAAEAGDAIAAAVFEETGYLLGMGLVGLVNLFNPERVVVGGGVARAGDWLLEPARRTVRQHAMRLQAETVQVVPAALGNDASLVGAALLAIERTTPT